MLNHLKVQEKQGNGSLRYTEEIVTNEVTLKLSILSLKDMILVGIYAGPKPIDYKVI